MKLLGPARNVARLLVVAVAVVSASLAAQQQDEGRNPRSQSESAKSAAQMPTSKPTVDPSPYTGEETRKYNQEANDIQRDIAIFTRQIVIDTERMADYTDRMVWVGVGVGLLQIVLLFFQSLHTGRAANAAKASADAVKLAERAYFDMAHEEGLSNTTVPDGVNVAVRVRVKNRGRTPAVVSDVVVGFKVAKWLKRQPSHFNGPYKRANNHRPKAFMVPDKKFFVHANETVTSSEWTQVNARQMRLYVLGYVDYTDAFGERRRTGYARVYVPGKARNNLVFFKTAGYNYDRPRQQGEGDDWRES